MAALSYGGPSPIVINGVVKAWLSVGREGKSQAFDFCQLESSADEPSITALYANIARL